MAHPKITAKIENITPTIAAKYLELMVPNRKLKPATVHSYVNDMANGRWIITPQGIAFNTDGELFDGQHRMEAVKESGLTIPMLVLRGFPTEQEKVKTMDVVDSGIGRSIPDRLKLIGGYYKNPNLLCAAARKIASTVMGKKNTAEKLSLHTIIEVVKIWKKELNAVLTVLDSPKYRHARNCHSIAAFTIAAATDLKKTDRDMGKFSTGAGLTADSPLLELRNAMFDSIMDVPARERTSHYLSAIYCAWHDIPGDSYKLKSNIERALEFFADKQAARYKRMKALFH